MVIIAIYIWREMAFSLFRVVYSHGEVIKLKRVSEISGSTHLRTVCTCWHTTIIRDCLLEPSVSTNVVPACPEI